MHHLHIDRFAGLSSPVHAIDPRAKLVTTLLFAFLVVLTPDGFFMSYAVYFLAALAVIAVSHVPVGYVSKRSLTLLPFVVFISIFVPFITPGAEVAGFDAGPFRAIVTDRGIVRFLSIVARAVTVFFATITLVSTTRFGDLMRAAGALGLPAKLVVVLSFMYRYLFILVDEASHMLLARSLRTHGNGGAAVLKASGGIVGALFVRSFEHAERLYEAMMLRGYTGNAVSQRPMRLGARDIALCGSFIVLSLAGLALGFTG